MTSDYWEIWSLTASPTNPNLFFTCYNTGAEFKGSLWEIQENSPTLRELVELKPISGILRCVLWDSSGKSSYVVSVDDSNVRVFDLDANFSNPKATVTIPTSQGKNITGALDPLHPNMVAVALDATIKGYDFRTPKEAYSIDKAHTEGVRDIDFNPNKAYYFASGGDDAKLKFWDVRNIKEPVKVLTGHSHWVWNVKYNRYQDQLVVSSSSDNQVKLWNVKSISSSNKQDHEDDPESINPQPIPTKGQKGKKHTDALIKTFEEHEDSVYSVAWGAATTWLFASLSYDGRVVINYVPKEYADITRY
eukprot:Phypoly_transcript_08851.p1 GENE.Phypoly_transcript_08851~~Phypoly_transcript_08851.p1  ORF type:complete len:305 (+),score=48.60 Phypoly_transcript_08851:502-1416(+)